jgi:hypothetical protein
MIIDYQNLFSNDQAVTVSAASTNVIDLGDDSARVKALNEKGEIEILCQVTTAFEGGTSLAVKVQTDNDEAFGSPTDVVASAAVGYATLVAGYQFKIAVAANLINEQYARLYYTVVGTMSAGKVLGALVLDRQTN